MTGVGPRNPSLDPMCPFPVLAIFPFVPKIQPNKENPLWSRYSGWVKDYHTILQTALYPILLLALNSEL